MDDEALLELGSLLTSKEVVLDLREIEDPLTLGEVAGFLGLPTDDVLSVVINDPDNVFVMRTLYSALADSMSYEVDDPSHEDMRWLLSDFAFEDDPYYWELPRAVIQLPYSELFHDQLRRVFANDMNRMVRFTPGDAAFLEGELKLLEGYTKELMKSVDKHRKWLSKATRELSVLLKLEKICELQDYANETSRHLDSATMPQVKLGQLYDEVKILRREANEEFIDKATKNYPGSTGVNKQKSWAEKILVALDSPNLGRILELIYRDPSLVSDAAFRRIHDTLLRATTAVLQTPLAKELLDDFVYPAFHAFLEQEPPGLEDALAGASSDLRQGAQDWEAMLRSLSTKDPKTQRRDRVLELTGKYAGVFSAATSVMCGLLEVHAIEIVTKLHNKWLIGSRVGGFLVRAVASASATNSVQRSGFLASFVAAVEEADPVKKAAKIKQLQVHDRVFKGGIGVGLAFLANLAALISVVGKDEEASWKRMFEVAAAIVSTAGALADGIDAAARLTSATGQGIKGMQIASKALGGIAGMLALVATCIDVYEKAQKYDTTGVAVGVVGALGSVASLAGWVLSFSVYAGTVAPQLLLAGAIISAGALVLGATIVALTPGMQTCFVQYWDHFTRKNNPLLTTGVRKTLANQIKLVDLGLSGAREISLENGGLVSSFSTLVAPSATSGKRFDLFHALSRRGFSSSDVQTMFKLNATEVVPILGK